MKKEDALFDLLAEKFRRDKHPEAGTYDPSEPKTKLDIDFSKA